jgi:hypothetical protein
MQVTNYGVEQRALDAAIDDEHVGLWLSVLGYTLLVFATIPAVWIWTGWRAGSMFWFWYTLGLGVCGTFMAGAGTFYRKRAAQDFATVLRLTVTEERPPVTRTGATEPPTDRAA